MDDEVKKALDLRLARGMIGVEEYRQLLCTLNTAKESQSIRHETLISKDGVLLAELDDLRVFSTHINVANRIKRFDEVESISGGMNHLVVGVLSSVKHSWISVKFTNGDTYYQDEERTVFGKDRHRKIMRCIEAIRAKTFKCRFDHLVQRLVENKQIVIGRETDERVTLIERAIDAVRIPQFADVELSLSGEITNGVITLDLKRCRANGLLELGIKRMNKLATDEIYACHERSLMERPRTKALKFCLNVKEGNDVAMTVIDRLASVQ